MDAESAATVELPTDALHEGDTPRIEGPDDLHVRSLIGVTVPPIVVHRQTMRVVDGVHRLRAAQANGDRVIRAVLVDGDERDMFVLAVRLNASNGLPLSLADRRAAAERLVGTHPEWSDRLIADLTGLSPRSVAVLRTRSSPEAARSNTRIGRDGTVRPLDVTAGRNRAARLIDEQPSASLRTIAAAAGISLGTAQDVRRRVRAGLAPVPEGRRRTRTPARTSSAATPAVRPVRAVVSTAESCESLLGRLRQDPSLRFSAGGRAVLRLLDAHLLSAPVRTALRASIPAHCVDTVSVLARRRAEAWLRFADEIGPSAESDGA